MKIRHFMGSVIELGRCGERELLVFSGQLTLLRKRRQFLLQEAFLFPNLLFEPLYRLLHIILVRLGIFGSYLSNFDFGLLYRTHGFVLFEFAKPAINLLSL